MQHVSGINPQAKSPEPKPPVPPEVRRSLMALALALNYDLSEEQMTLVAYSLRDLLPRFLRAACAELAAHAQFWPKPVELREAAERIRQAEERFTARQQVSSLPDELQDDATRFFCPDCRDEWSSWRFFWCQGAGELKNPDSGPDDRHEPIYYCGRKFPHRPHHYTERCHCRGTNPRVQHAHDRYNQAKARHGK